MPRYTTKRKKKTNREKRRLRKTVPRDRRKLMRWAARGDSNDYEKLRRNARKLMVDYDIPAFVNFDDVEQLANTDKSKLIQAIHHDNVRTYAHPHLRGFLDALSFVLDKANLRGWDWPANLLKQGTKVFRGEKLTELDELYAKIVDDSYRKRPDRVEDYYRVPEFDSDYVTVWETSDGHRLVSVRGTVPTNPSDLLKDAEIAATGTVSADTIGATLQDIVHMTLYFTDRKTQWPVFDKVRREIYPVDPPVTVGVGTSDLGAGAALEIDALAVEDRLLELGAGHADAATNYFRANLDPRLRRRHLRSAHSEPPTESFTALVR